jgi:hypothetical protein
MTGKGGKGLGEDDRKAIVARAKARGFPAQALERADELIVDGKGLTLRGDRDKARTPITPDSLDELVAAIGAGARDRDAVAASKSRGFQRDQVLQLVHRTKARVDRDLDVRRVANVALKAAMQGLVSRDELVQAGFDKYFEQLLKPIRIWPWLFTTITVRSGSALTFSDPGPHTLVAYRLVIEPNARIVLNHTAVSIDCDHLEIQ